MTDLSRIAGVEALLFDVFGTVVDWRSGVAREASVFLRQHAPHVDGHDLADAWRSEYQPSMEEIRSNKRPFTRLDVLHRENLERALGRLGVDPASVPARDLDELTLAWHRLDPWPDSVAGLTRLREQYIIAPLSNANIRLSLDMAKRAGLPWDAILGAEVVQAYKPSPESYLRTAELLALEPHQTALVAAHNSDLAAAREAGLRTVFVPRPTEHGAHQTLDLKAAQDWDVIAHDFLDLADRIAQPDHPS